jgi:transposase
MILLQLLTGVIMARKTKRAALVLTGDQRALLTDLAGSRTAPIREVERGKILFGHADGASISDLMRRVGVGRPMIYKCIDKALAAGVGAGLKDAYHRPHEPEITEEAKAWVVSIACTKPEDHGLAAELWSISALARFVSEGAETAGHPRLARAGKSTVWRILKEQDIKPHKIRYYLERRDPEFDRKMQEVLLVYRDVSLSAEGAVNEGRPRPIYTVSVDEKPGVQALGLTAPDLPPVPGKAMVIGRDYEYVRHGTVSMITSAGFLQGVAPRARRTTAAAIDLAPVAVAAQQNLGATAPAKKEAARRLHRRWSSRRGAAVWTGLSGPWKMARHSLSRGSGGARHGMKLGG